jgi:hypothetical protein
MLLHAATPTVPPAIRERMAVPLDFDSPQAQEQAAQLLIACAELVQRQCIMAGENLRIAQHRDTLRYAHTRSGNYEPRLQRFEPGDYVYVKQETHSTLQFVARSVILRVQEVRASGVLLLASSDGNTAEVHMQNCAPCQLANIDPMVDYSGAKLPDTARCLICNSPEEGARMLACDGCNTGWHMHCLVPPLTRTPAGHWLCPACVAEGLILQEIAARAAKAARQRAREQAQPVIHPDRTMRTRDEAARLLDGRLVRKRDGRWPNAARLKCSRYWARALRVRAIACDQSGQRSVQRPGAVCFRGWEGCCEGDISAQRVHQ